MKEFTFLLVKGYVHANDDYSYLILAILNKKKPSRYVNKKTII